LYMQAARDQLKKYSNSANFFFGINANSDNDFLDVAKNLPEDSFIIFLTWQKDDAGQYRNPEIFYPALAKVANSPIFTVIDNLIDGGFVGGFVLSANKNGDLIGREAANILRGHVLGGANLGFIKKGVLAAPLFNAESLWRWRMNSKNLPAGSTIIKQKKTFLETYLFGTLMTSCFVALLISIIIVELYFFIKYKKNAAKYQKLFKRNSVILRSLPIGVELYDRDGFMISANDADCQIFGIDKRKGFDKNVINIFKDPNIAEAMLKDLRRGMNVCAYLDYDFDKVKKNKYYSTTRSGIKHIECNAAPVFNSHGDIESYVLIFQDISLRYAREQNMESFRRDVNLALESDNLALWHMDAKTCEFTLLSGTGYLKTTTTLDDFTLLVEPSMRDEYRRSFEDLLYGKLTRKILDFKFTNSARIISTRSGMSAIVENGVVTGVVGINRYRVLDGEDKN